MPELGIDADEGTSRRGSGGSRRPTTTGTPKVVPTGETFIVDGVLYTDFRAAKAAPGYAGSPNFPDFKRESDDKPFWLYDKDSGAPNEDVKELVAAADTKIF